ncbi:hypothetical protein LWI28_011569 [Acer negundo]|uniref:Uncharacterized protein n=1 Tax=Acer negundo TaxID=4023 RepID=A0AAD5JSI8_ACENE|nr:hypothetical protein LWI28_011569 [Acer negundo]
MIGDVVEVDGSLARDCVGKFMRVCVRIDIDKPLTRCLRMDVMGDKVESIMLLRDPGGPTFFSKYSSGSYSNAGTSGMVTKSAIKSTEVHDQKDKVVKEMVVGDDVMNDVLKNLES